jgi:phasin family protein
MSKGSKPTKKATVSEDSKPINQVTVSNDGKPAEKSAVSNDSNPTEEITVSHEIKPTKKGEADETPVSDFTKLMSQFRLPGVDFAALVDRERKDIEALAKANRIAFEGWQRLVRRQAEMLRETMKKVVADVSQENAKKKRADLAKEGFEKALANMRELAEIPPNLRKRPSTWFARGSKKTWKASEILERKLANECIPGGCRDPLVASYSRLPSSRCRGAGIYFSAPRAAPDVPVRGSRVALCALCVAHHAARAVLNVAPHAVACQRSEPKRLGWYCGGWVFGR